MQAVLSVEELMGRFRANLIIKGDDDAPPFVEDTWTELSIGDFHFEVQSLHPHLCIHTCVDMLCARLHKQLLLCVVFFVACT